MTAHKPFCAVVTDDVEICTCGALLRSVLSPEPTDRSHAASSVSADTAHPDGSGLAHAGSQDGFDS